MTAFLKHDVSEENGIEEKLSKACVEFLEYLEGLTKDPDTAKKIRLFLEKNNVWEKT